ncbi:Uncharacterised protein [marine metagenome]
MANISSTLIPSLLYRCLMPLGVQAEEQKL